MKELHTKSFGTTKKGQPITLYTLENDYGDQISFIEYAAAIVGWKIAEEDQIKDIVLGFDTLEEYEASTANFGSVCGRFANRIRNGEFRLNNRIYKVPKGNRVHPCHSGPDGFAKQVFELVEAKQDAVTFQYTAKDGETGFPGNFTAKITYTFGDDRALYLDYELTTDQDTVFNLTNHSYFTIDGEGTVDEQYLEVNARFITPSDEDLVPTGEIRLVEGTDFDLRSKVRLQDLFHSNDPVLTQVGGLDHNFIVDGEERGEMRYAARIISKDMKSQLVCYTTEPGIQVYTTNMLPEQTVSNGRKAGSHCAICLETQNFPDAPNITFFPSPVLKAGETYHSQTIYTYVPYMDLSNS